MSTRLKEKIQQRDFKLNALLEITIAINANLTVEQLFGQYEKVLHQHLGIEKLALFTKEEHWSCVLKYGIADFDIPDVTDEKFFTQSAEVKLRQESFDIVIPILHEEKPIAYLLVGDVEEGMKISPVIKHMKFIQTLTNVLVVAIENRKLQVESLRQAQVKRELELAAEMQAILLPAHLPKNEFYEAASFYKAHQQVGGDYYDFIELNRDEVMFCMADVSGKGVSAAFLMANFQAYLRSIFSYMKTDLASMVRELNRQVMHSAMGEKYITLFLATYNKQTRTLRYINCGHNPPVLADEHGYTQLLKLGSIGLGMFDEIPKIAMGELQLPVNSTVVCYTDGLVEPENSQLEEFGIERLEKTILANYAKSVELLNNTIMSALNNFKGDMPYTDDVALLSCRFF